jgi:ubiquinone/menaquinone biosynthesis C-methylase UbiE
MSDTTKRFSEQAGDYRRYRPGYPAAVITLLQKELGFSSGWKVADVGSGTGLSAELFLNHGNEVWAVEPNPEMREAAEEIYGQQPGFHSVAGTASATGLDQDSVHLVCSAQAFHWFDVEEAKAEFARILQPGGRIVLIWNERVHDDAFHQAYEALLYERIEGYREINETKIDRTKIAQLLAPQPLQEQVLDNIQLLDREGLKGRTRSSSYCPRSGPVYEQLMEELDLLFDRYQENGQLAFRYHTRVFW